MIRLLRACLAPVVVIVATVIAGMVIAAPPAQAGGCPAPMPLERALKERVLMIATAGDVSADHYRTFEVVEAFNAGLESTIEVYDPRAAGNPGHEVPAPAWVTGETYALALIARKNGAFNVHACEARADAASNWIADLRQRR